MKTLDEVLNRIEWTFETAAKHPMMFVSCAECLEAILSTLDELRWFVLDDEIRRGKESYGSYLTANGFGPFSFMSRRRMQVQQTNKDSDTSAFLREFVVFWQGFLDWRRQFSA